MCPPYGPLNRWRSAARAPGPPIRSPGPEVGAPGAKRGHRGADPLRDLPRAAYLAPLPARIDEASSAAGCPHSRIGDGRKGANSGRRPFHRVRGPGPITTRTRAAERSATNRGHQPGRPRARRSPAPAAQYVTSRAGDASNPVTQRSGAAESNGHSHTQRRPFDRPSPERQTPPAEPPHCHGNKRLDSGARRFRDGRAAGAQVQTAARRRRQQS